MKPLLVAMLLTGLCHAATMFQVKYLGSDNNGFTILYDADHPPSNDVATGQNTPFPYESIIVNGSPLPGSSIGANPGQFEANTEIILGLGGSLIQFFLTDATTNTIVNQYGGVVFPTVRNLPEGQTLTLLGNQSLIPDGSGIGIATLTVTNVSPEPVSSSLVAGGLFGLLACGYIKRTRVAQLRSCAHRRSIAPYAH